MLPLWDANPPKRAPVMTVTLILVNIAVFAYEVQLAMGGRMGPFVLEHALVPGRLLAGWDDGVQWLTVLTHMFLHGGFAHMLGNCWFLWVFGRNVEDRLGSGGFLLLYLLAGAAAAALQVLVAPSSPLPMIGASGAIPGVLGAYLILFPTAWIYTLVPWIVPIVPVPAFLFLRPVVRRPGVQRFWGAPRQPLGRRRGLVGARRRLRRGNGAAAPRTEEIPAEAVTAATNHRRARRHFRAAGGISAEPPGRCTVHRNLPSRRSRGPLVRG